MLDAATLTAMLDSFGDPVVFADADHIIRYMNPAGVAKYGEGLVGTNVMACHNEQSQAQMLEIWEAMKQGEQQRLIAQDETRRVYMRAVRDQGGRLLGYYEWYTGPGG